MTVRIVDAPDPSELPAPAIEIRSSAQRISVLFVLAARPDAVMVVLRLPTRRTVAVSINRRPEPPWRSEAKNGAAAVRLTSRTKLVATPAVLERNGQRIHQNRIDDLPPPWTSTKRTLARCSSHASEARRKAPRTPATSRPARRQEATFLRTERRQESQDGAVVWAHKRGTSRVRHPTSSHNS